MNGRKPLIQPYENHHPFIHSRSVHGDLVQLRGCRWLRGYRARLSPPHAPTAPLLPREQLLRTLSQSPHPLSFQTSPSACWRQCTRRNSRTASECQQFHRSRPLLISMALGTWRMTRSSATSFFIRVESLRFISPSNPALQPVPAPDVQTRSPSRAQALSAGASERPGGCGEIRPRWSGNTSPHAVRRLH